MTVDIKDRLQDRLDLPQDRLLSRQEAAEYLGVKPQTLAVWATTKRYDLPYVKVGRLPKYRLSVLNAFLERNTVSMGAE